MLNKNNTITVIKNLFLYFLFIFYNNISFSLNPEQKLNQYVFDYWTEKSGLEKTTISDLARTDDGYLWIGTEGGLIRFNGFNFELFDKEFSKVFKENYITCLMADDNGVLWIGSYSKGLIKYENGNFKKIIFNNELDKSDVYSILKVSKNEYWFGTYQHGLFQVKDGVSKQFLVKDGLKSNRNIRCLIKDSKNKIWIGTEKGINIYENGKIKSVLPKSCSADNNIFAICEDKKGNFWAGGFTKGLIKINNSGYRIYTEKDGLVSNTIRSLLVDKDGILWIASNESGVSRFINGKFENFNNENGLTNNSIRKILEDKDNLLWIGTRDGLNRLKDGVFTSYTKKEGLNGEFVRTLFYDKFNDILYIGTANNGLKQFKNNKFTNINYNTNVNSKSVFAIYKDESNELWIGTYGTGIKIKTKNKLISITKKDGLTNNYVRSFFKDSKGNMWVGTRSGLNLIKNKKVIKTYTKKNGLSHNYIRVITETKDGSLWFGTWEGLNRINNGKIQIIKKGNGLISDNISSFYNDEDGVLWIGTYRGGLVRYKNNKFKTITKNHGLIDDIYALVEDNLGNFWIGGKSGVLKVSKKQINNFLDKLSLHFKVIHYDKEDGMKSSTCSGGVQNTSCKSNDGKIWFATVNGITFVDPLKLSDDREFNTIIEKFTLDRKPLKLNKKLLLLPPGKSSIDIHYTSLNFKHISKLRFYYKLEPYDNYWVDAGKRTVAYYTNIPPGDYTFYVKAVESSKNLDNAKPAFIKFKKDFYFYENKYFYPLLILLFIILVLVFNVRRIKKAKVILEKLERMVDDRTLHLNNEKMKLEKALKEIQNAKLKISKINERLFITNEHKNEIIGMVVHDLKSPITSIKGYCEVLQLNIDKKDKLIKGIKIINESSNKMLNLINKLLDKSSNEAEEIKLKMERINCNNITEDILISLSYIFERKNQEIVFKENDEVFINGDAIAIREIIENLLSNANKFSPLNSKIEVSISKISNKAVISIKDSGPGITKEDEKNIFKKYQKLSAKPTFGETSTGLGLYIVKKLVDLQNGEITYNSTENEGTTFFVRFDSC